VTKHRVIVEVDFGVERDEAFVFRQEERVDLHERGVHLLIGFVESLHELRGRVDQVGGQAEAEGEFARLIRAEADGRINRLFENFFGRVRGHLFDVHAARLRRHKHGTPRRAIQHDAEIKFPINRQALFDEQHAHLAPFRPRLVRDESHAEHLRGDVARLFGRLGEFDAAAFAAPARVDLRFDYNDVRAQFLRGVESLFGRVRHDPARDGHTEFP
jgi:hypothetical protein